MTLEFSIRLISLTFFCIFLGSCVELPFNSYRKDSWAFSNTESTKIGKYVHPEVTKYPGLSGFYPLADGHDALAIRLALIDQAECSIDAQYYLFHTDLVGCLFMYHLLLAADRGVRVRLLVDDLSSVSADKVMAIANSHPNIEIRLFNPVIARGIWRPVQLVTDFSRINRRMHNKAFIVDNQVGIVGGRNIGDEYYKASAVEFTDLDMLLIGKVVPDISSFFDLYWNSRLSFPVEAVLNEKVNQSEVKIFKEKLKSKTLSSDMQQGNCINLTT